MQIPTALSPGPARPTLIALASLSLFLGGCAISQPPTSVTLDAAPHWQAPLPHQGKVENLAQWWQQQGDPLLVELIDAAQAVSPSVGQALARIEAARASKVGANAALAPKLDGSLSASRAKGQPDETLANSLSVGLQASWELDLVGANRVVSKAALAQLQGREAQWHDARISVAAEVANLYYDLATCLRLTQLARQDAASRQETARLADLSTRAGFTAPATAALARASASEGKSRVTQQATLCEQDTKALVALTAIAEPVFRKKLALALVQYEQLAPISVVSVPAQVVAQRPDVFAAEREVVVASAQVSSADAQAYPRLSLNGAIAATRVSAGGVQSDFNTWSFGPLTLSLPLFDAGQRTANLGAAQASYQAVVTSYRATVRQAIREVEDVLLKLQSTQDRSTDAQTATQGYAESLAATQNRYGHGLASLVELEDARRAALAAQMAQVNLQLERQLAWVSLYRALGGGWQASPTTPTASAS